jgi:hypothetical protein
VDFITVFTSITGRLILHFLPAHRATIVAYFVINLNSLNEATYFVKFGLLLLLILLPRVALIGVVLCHCLQNFLDQFKIVIFKILLLLFTVQVRVSSYGALIF